MTSAPSPSPCACARHSQRRWCTCSWCPSRLLSRPGCCSTRRSTSPISSLFFDAERQLFIGRRSGMFELLGHQAARGLPIAVGVVALGVAYAASAVRASLRPWRWLGHCAAIALVLTPSVISLLKSSTAAHCPAQRRRVGGAADYRAERDGSRSGPHRRGRPAAACSSAHAGAGYALLGLYFAGWAAGVHRWRWLGLGIGTGAPGSCSARCASLQGLALREPDDVVGDRRVDHRRVSSSRRCSGAGAQARSALLRRWL